MVVKSVIDRWLGELFSTSDEIVCSLFETARSLPSKVTGSISDERKFNDQYLRNLLKVTMESCRRRSV